MLTAPKEASSNSSRATQSPYMAAAAAYFMTEKQHRAMQDVWYDTQRFHLKLPGRIPGLELVESIQYKRETSTCFVCCSEWRLFALLELSQCSPNWLRICAHRLRTLLVKK